MSPSLSTVLLCRNLPFFQIKFAQRINFRGRCLKAKRNIPAAVDALQDALGSAVIMAQQHSSLNFCTMLVVVSQPPYRNSEHRHCNPGTG